MLGARRPRRAAIIGIVVLLGAGAAAGTRARAATPTRPLVWVNAYGTYAVRTDGTRWTQLNDCSLTPLASNGRRLVGGFGYLQTERRRS